MNRWREKDLLPTKVLELDAFGGTTTANGYCLELAEDVLALDGSRSICATGRPGSLRSGTGEPAV